MDAEDLVYDQTTEQLKQLSLNVDGLVGGERRVGVRCRMIREIGLSYPMWMSYDWTSPVVEADAIADSQVDRITIDNPPGSGDKYIGGFKWNWLHLPGKREMI